MSSIELGRSDSRSSDGPAHQAETNNVRLEHELDDARREPDNNYWDAPIPNRLAAAFHIGRLLNQLDWHSQHVLFFVSPIDRKLIEEVLSRLLAVSYNLVDSHPNHLEVVITDYRDIWKEWLLCEAAADEVAACYDDCQLRHYSETSEGCRRRLGRKPGTAPA